MSAKAPNVGVLIAGRAVMGFGAAASEPGTLSMIRHIYTDERSGPGRSASGPRCPESHWPWDRSSAAR